MTREEAIAELREDKALYESDICHAGDGTPDGRLLQAIDMAIEALSADAVHGEWKFVDHEIFAGEYFCNICGKRANVDLYGEWILSNYCPSCGARMTPYKGGDTE